MVHILLAPGFEEMEALIDKKLKLQKEFDKKVQTG